MSFKAFAAMILLLSSCTSKPNFDAYGTIETRETTVSATQSGRVTDLFLEEGVKLPVGAVVVQIDSVPAHLQLQECMATVAAIKAQANDPEPTALEIRAQRTRQISAINQLQVKLHPQQKDAARYLNLYQASSGTQKQLDDAQANVDATQAELQTAKSELARIDAALNAHYYSVDHDHKVLKAQTQVLQAKLRQLERSLAETSVKTPIAGTILTRYINRGELVQPGSKLFSIANLEELYILVDIPAGKFDSLKLGGSVRVSVDNGQGGYRCYRGRVSNIGSVAEFSSGSVLDKDQRAAKVYPVKVELLHPDAYLKIGMPSFVTFNQ